jgi:peptidoglycan L-alanyl-D-glutamate endopeptidase CwlK
MSLVNEQVVFLQDVVKLVSKCSELGFFVTGGELFRTKEQQEIYVASGKSKTMNSMHLNRCAIDLNFFDKNLKLISDKKSLQAIGNFWESLDKKNRWGGNFKSFLDCPHFERNV